MHTCDHGMCMHVSVKCMMYYCIVIHLCLVCMPSIIIYTNVGVSESHAIIEFNLSSLDGTNGFVLTGENE